MEVFPPDPSAIFLSPPRRRFLPRPSALYHAVRTQWPARRLEHRHLHCGAGCAAVSCWTGTALADSSSASQHARNAGSGFHPAVAILSEASALIAVLLATAGMARLEHRFTADYGLAGSIALASF